MMQKNIEFLRYLKFCCVVFPITQPVKLVPSISTFLQKMHTQDTSLFHCVFYTLCYVMSGGILYVEDQDFYEGETVRGASL